MNAVTTKTVTITHDTGETIDDVTVLGDYHVNGGYDWMELIGEHGCRDPQLGLLGMGPWQLALCHVRRDPDR